MSMRTLTILQFTQIMCLYLVMTVFLPAFVLRVKMKGRRLAERFLICFMVGNFYLMNLVFVLQLLHISNRFTLILGTCIPVLILWLRMNKIKLLPKFQAAWQGIRRIVAGHLGIKTVLYRGFDFIGGKMKEGLQVLVRGFFKRWLEWLLLVVVLACIGYFYGHQIVAAYGYTASDTPVHLYWINGMDQNDIFIDGVYPFGYHCIIYYLHCVFNIDTYVLMRVFSLVQTTMLHLVLLAFIRLCCKSTYVAYAAVGIYVLGNFFQVGTYSRFFAVLPQEYGMLFILPAMYFAFRYFNVRRRELKKGKKKKESLNCLALFAISFSMTLAVHFYDTMIAGLFCVGIAIGYLFLFVRKQYFVNVVVTCLISVMIAVLPMGIAFATGTPLQGSLGWGMSVINGESATDDTENTDASTQESAPNVTYYDDDGNVIDTTQEETGVEGKEPAQERSFLEKLKYAWDKICGSVNINVLNQPQPWYYYIIVFSFIGALFLLGGFFFCFKKKRCYGAMLLSVAAFMALLSVLQGAKELGIPELMDAGRCRVYFAYMMPVVVALTADGLLNVFFFPRSWYKVRNVASLVCVVGAVLILSNDAYRKKPETVTTLVTDEAMICLTNIMEEEKDFTWTICSANDERQMVLNNGYHYELISFLREMEFNNMEEDAKPFIKIPTESVYIFVEKVPLDYTIMYENSGQTISEEGALRELPNVGGIAMYEGENRWIVMSRLYYWAQEFKRLYPNEVTTYMETENFVCYKVEQNTYRLFNFAIDYEYNSRKVKE